jgi:uncharacterized membrane protein YphA (DoxX/SURF4 family)
MKVLKILGKPEIYLRIGLAGTFIYSGYDIYKNPSNQIGYVETLPQWILDAVQSYMPLSMFLTIQGITEIIFGIILLVWFSPPKIIRLVSVLVGVKLILILYFLGIDTVTFRDIGLVGAVFALAAIEHKKS